MRIYTRVTQRPVEQSVELREETVIVERRPVQRAATAEDLSKTEEREFEVRTTAEEPVIAKAARVVEEVEVGKATRQRRQTVRDTVQRTDVDVEEVRDRADQTNSGNSGTATTP